MPTRVWKSTEMESAFFVPLLTGRSRVVSRLGRLVVPEQFFLFFFFSFFFNFSFGHVQDTACGVKLLWLRPWRAHQFWRPLHHRHPSSSLQHPPPARRHLRHQPAVRSLAMAPKPAAIHQSRRAPAARWQCLVWSIWISSPRARRAGCRRAAQHFVAGDGTLPPPRAARSLRASQPLPDLVPPLLPVCTGSGRSRGPGCRLQLQAPSSKLQFGSRDRMLWVRFLARETSISSSRAVHTMYRASGSR